MRYDDWIGAPFTLGGRSLETGIDCLGVVLLVLEDLGIQAEDPWQRLRRLWENDWRNCRDAMPDGWERVPFPGSLLQDGDVVVWQGHVGVMVDGWILSASAAAGVFRERLRRRRPDVWRFVP